MLTFSPRRSLGTRFSKKARSSLSLLFSSSSAFTWEASWACAVCSIFRRDSLALAIERNLAASLSSRPMDSRSLANSFCSSLRSNPANRRPASYIHVARASASERNTSIPSQRQYQATCVWTVIFGAEIPKRWRNCLKSLDIGFSAAGSGHNGQLRETHRLLESKHDIHILHRLSRSALRQFIDHRDHDKHVCPVRAMDCDTAGIGAPHRARIRFTSAREDVDERLAAIAILIQSLKLDVRGDACIQSCVYAPNHGHQMRHERETDASSGSGIQLLPNLRPMTMAGHAIGFEIIGGFGEQQMFFGLLAGTAHPGLGIRDQVIEVDGAGFRKGQQSELNRGWVAPGIRHQAC